MAKPVVWFVGGPIIPSRPPDAIVSGVGGGAIGCGGAKQKPMPTLKMRVAGRSASAAGLLTRSGATAAT